VKEYDKEPSGSEELHIFSFATGKSHSLSYFRSIRGHIDGFAWSPDSQALLFYTWPSNLAESRESAMPSDRKDHIAIYTVGITRDNVIPECIGVYNQSPGLWDRQSFVWPSSHSVVDISKYDIS
jgi:hypothetical protein